jgi:hypothetical protein
MKKYIFTNSTKLMYKNNPIVMVKIHFDISGSVDIVTPT